MNDTPWASEHSTAAALDGLNAEETLRFEQEASSELKQAADGVRAVDATLRQLFAPEKPVVVEASSVVRLRQEWTRETMERGWRRKLTYGLAASVGLGLVGAGVMAMGGLPMPGPLAFRSSIGAKANVSAMDLIAGVDGPNTTRMLSESAPAGNRWNSQMTPAAGGGQNGQAQGVLPSIPTPSKMYDEGRSSFNVQASKEKLDMRPDRQKADIDSTVPSKNWGDNVYFYKSSEDRRKVSDMPADASKQPGAVTDYAVIVPPVAETHIENGLAFGAEKTVLGRSKAVEKNLQGQVTDLELKLRTAGESKNGALAEGLGVASQTTKPAPSVPPGAQPGSAGAPAASVIRKIIIRSGEIEFEVESFDNSVSNITGLVTKINGAFVATVNSEKMANGKVKGSVVVRIPPESLDPFVLDLRKELAKGGELKGQRIGSQDITKQYTDLESRLKAARTMETRLLEMIKNGKGEIKQLLDAEKELGVWRTKIEEYEGELRFYSNQASLSTLTITIAEKEIRQAATLTESEKISAGLEVEDVDKSYRALQAAIAELKGHIVKSEMKTHTFGQSATVAFEVSPESTGPMQDRLKQIGNVARLNSDRVQSSDGQPVPRDAKVKRGDTRFDVQIYNLTSVRPRETATVQLAVPNVGESFVKLREAITKANGRVLNANLNEQDKHNVIATIDFEVKRADEAQIRSAFEAAGETVSRNVVRAPEAEVMTDAKVLYRTTLSSTERIAPREKLVLASEVSEVDPVVAVLNAYVRDTNGTVVDESSVRDRGKVTTRVIYQVPLTAASALAEKVKAAGMLRVSNSSRDANAPDGKFALARVEVTISNEERIVSPDEGIWPQVRKGLSYSARVLLQSVTWVVFGLCVVLPWAIVGYGGYRLIKRLGRTTPPAA